MQEEEIDYPGDAIAMKYVIRTKDGTYLGYAGDPIRDIYNAVLFDDSDLARRAMSSNGKFSNRGGAQIIPVHFCVLVNVGRSSIVEIFQGENNR